MKSGTRPDWCSKKESTFSTRLACLEVFMFIRFDVANNVCIINLFGRKNTYFLPDRSDSIAQDFICGPLKNRSTAAKNNHLF